MKFLKLQLIIIFALLVNGLVWSQTQGINYKTLIKDTNGNVVANQSITIEFEILRGAGFNLVYTENHNPTTDANGIVIVNIGEGSILHGNFGTIDWSIDIHFLNVKIDIGGGLVDFGRTQFKTVPYAIQADKALNVSGLETIDEGNGIGWRLVGKNPDNYGNIGENAIDLSFSTLPASNVGATGFAALASGITTKAFGDRSTAMGLNSEASGDTSTAFGNSTIASGDYATSMGLGTTASGNYSTSFGWNTEASGLYAMAGGNGSDAIGIASLAFGVDNIASGDHAVAIGQNSLASDEYSLAFGLGSEATNSYAVAIGENVNASGVASLATGNNTAASGTSSTAIGFITIASGNASTAMGSATTASGFTATAMGFGSNAFGDSSTAMGDDTTAGGIASFTSGFNTLASGNFSASFGRNTNAHSFTGIAFGRYNVGGGNFQSWVETDPLFEIGNGSANNARANALTILKNGNLGLGTSSPNNKLQITNGTDVSAFNDLGFLVLGNGNGTNIALDNNEIMARNNNDAAPLFLQNEGFNHVSLSNGSGLVVIGNEGSANMVFDHNDIQARNNNAPALLFLQQYGGNVAVGNTVVHTSDRRLKKNIDNLSYGLNEILQLQPKSYHWKNRNQQYKSLGLIAQDVKLIIKEIVTTQDNEQKTLSISYTELIPVLINAIKEQNKIIRDQKNEIDHQNTALLDVLKRLDILETKIK